MGVRGMVLVSIAFLFVLFNIYLFDNNVAGVHLVYEDDCRQSVITYRYRCHCVSFADSLWNSHKVLESNERVCNVQKLSI